MPQTRRTWLVVAAFLLPNLAGFLVFTLAPVVLSFGMAFTNWSLKPAVRFEWLGLRNFTDLLWLEIGPGRGGAVAGYVAAAAALTAGLGTALWAAVARWRGTRASSAAFAGLGVAVLLA